MCVSVRARARVCVCVYMHKLNVHMYYVQVIHQFSAIKLQYVEYVL